MAPQVPGQRGGPVPRLTGPQVQLRPASTPFQRGIVVPQAFGDGGQGLQQAGAQLDRIGEQTAAHVLQIQREQNINQAKAADVDFSAIVREALFGTDEEPGYLSSQGENAITGASAVDERLERERQRIRQSLPQAVQEQFDQVADRRLERARESIIRHTSRQRQIASATAAEARLNAFTSDAAANFADPEARQEALRGAVQEARDVASVLGLDADATAAKITETQTAVHAAVLDGMLAAGMVDQAERYFGENRDQIDGTRHAQITRLIEREKRSKLGELRDLVRDNIAILSAGKTPAGLDGLRAAVRGTDLGRALDEAVADRRHMDEFAHLSIPEQRARLRELQRRETFTPSEFRRFQGFARQHAQTLQQLDQGHGLTVAADRGFIGEPEPLDYSDPESLRARRRQAEQASEALGFFVGILTPQEAEGLASHIQNAPSEQVTALLRQLHSAVGREHATEIAGELMRGDRPELGSAILLAETDPETAADIIRGSRMRAELGGTLELPQADRRDAWARVGAPVFEGLDHAELPVAELLAAADALYASRRVPGGDLTFDMDAYEQALRDVMGGPVGHRGRAVLPPVPGMDTDQFDDLVSGLTNADLRRFGSPVRDDGTELTVDDLRPRGLLQAGRSIEFVSVAPGRYRLRQRGLGFVRDAESGGFYEIDLRRVLDEGHLSDPIEPEPMVEPEPPAATVEPEPEPRADTRRVDELMAESERLERNLRDPAFARREAGKRAQERLAEITEELEALAGSR